MDSQDEDLLRQLTNLLSFLGNEMGIKLADANVLLSTKRAQLNLIRSTSSQQQQQPGSSPPLLLDWSRLQYPESFLTALASWDIGNHGNTKHQTVWLASLIRLLAHQCSEDDGLVAECLGHLADVVAKCVERVQQCKSTKNDDYYYRINNLPALIIWLESLNLVADDSQDYERKYLTTSAIEAVSNLISNIRSDLPRSSRLLLYLAFYWTRFGCLTNNWSAEPVVQSLTSCCLPTISLEKDLGDVSWPGTNRLTEQQKRLLACAGLCDSRDRVAELAELCFVGNCQLDQLVGETAIVLLKDGAPDALLSRLFSKSDVEGKHGRRGDAGYFAETASRAIASQWRKLGDFSSVERAVQWAVGDESDSRNLQNDLLIRARDYCAALRGIFRDCGISLTREQEYSLVIDAGRTSILGQLASVESPALLPDCRQAVEALTRAVSAAANAAALESPASVVNAELSLFRAAQSVACSVRALTVDAAVSSTSGATEAAYNNDDKLDSMNAIAALISLAGQLANHVTDLRLRGQLLKRLLELLFLTRRQLRSFNRLARDPLIGSLAALKPTSRDVDSAGLNGGANGNDVVASDAFVRLHLTEMRQLITNYRQQAFATISSVVTVSDELVEAKNLATWLESRLADLQWRQELIASLPPPPLWLVGGIADEGVRHRRHRKSSSILAVTTNSSSIPQSGSEDSSSKQQTQQQPQPPQSKQSPLVHYLQCSGSTILALCLSRGDFQRASQTVKIYNLQGLRLCSELQWQSVFSAKLKQLRTMSIGAVAAANLSNLFSNSASNSSVNSGSVSGFGQASLSAIRATASPLVRQGPVKLAEELLSQLPDRLAGSLVAMTTSRHQQQHHYHHAHHHQSSGAVIDISVLKRVFGGPTGSAFTSDFAHLLDLACVGAVSLPALRDLLLLAKDRMPQNPKKDSEGSLTVSSSSASDSISNTAAAAAASGPLPPAALLVDLDSLVEFFWHRVSQSHPAHQLWWSWLLSPDSAAARSGVPFYTQLACQFLLPPCKPQRLEEAMLEIGSSGAKFRVAMTTAANAETNKTSGATSASAAIPLGLGRRSASAVAFSPTPSSYSTSSNDSAAAAAAAAAAASPAQLFQALVRVAAKHSTTVSNVFQLSGFSKCNLEFYNFLEALLDHVTALGEFLAKIYANRLDQRYLVTSPGVHPFDILSESPSTALGKLIFELHVAPNKLEDLAQRLGLNLSHIIIKNSMPRINTKARPKPEPDKTLFSLTEPAASQLLCRVVNDCKSWTGQSRDPHQAVVSISKELTRVFKPQLTSTAGAPKPHWLNRHQLAKVAASDAFKDWRTSLGELKFVDLTFLKSANDRLAFFLNLRNLIAVHFAIEISNLWTDPVLSSCPLLACKSHSREFTYWIGSLGPVSLGDIDDFVLGIGKTRRTDMKFLNVFHPELCDYAQVEQPDPLLVFGLVQFQRVSPPFKTYSAHSIKDDLLKSCHQFVAGFVALKSATSADSVAGSESITLPHWLAYYAPMLQQQTSTRSESQSSRLWDPASVLASLRRLCSGPQLAQTWAHLCVGGGGSVDTVDDQQLMLTQCQLDEPELSEFGVCLDYPSGGGGLGRSASTAGLPASTDDDSRRPYSITMATLDYLRDSSPLLATLVSLACPEQVSDSLSLTLHLDHFATGVANVNSASNSSGFEHVSSRSPISSSNNSSATLCGVGGGAGRGSDVGFGIDIRSYLYQRLAHSFPQLGQHVLRHFAPMAHSPAVGPVESLLKLCSRSPTEAWTAHMYKRMLHHPASEPHLAMVARTLERMAETDDFSPALSVLQSCQSQTRACLPTERLTDWLVSRYLSSESSLRDPSSSLSCLYSVSCPRLASRLTLACLNRFSASRCVQLLSRCQQRLAQARSTGSTMSSDEALDGKLSDRLKTIQVLGDIMRVARENYSPNQAVLWRTWSELEADDTDRILDFLLIGVKQFDLALRWAAYFRPDVSTKERILSAKLQGIVSSRGLDGDQEFYAELCSTVEREGAQFALQLCRSIIDNPDIDPSQQSPLAVLLCAYFALERLSDQLYSDEVDEIMACLLGSRILLMLGNPPGYGHLRCRPELIVEQLMMNSMPGEAKRAAEVWLCEQELLGRSSAGAKATIDGLALAYARKALEVAAIAPRSGVAGSGGGGAGLLERQRSASECSVQVTQTVFSSGVNSSQADMASLVGFQQQQQQQPSLSLVGSNFRPPSQQVARSAWLPDSMASRCMCCDRERFSMFQRRHHCRWCGRVVCGACSEATVAGGGGRVCSTCEPVARQQQQQQQRTSTAQTAGTGGGYMDQFPATQKDRSQWTLSPDNEDLNASLREDFYYDQSPSSSLANALLEMHSQPSEHLLKLCDQLSEYLSPVDRFGTPNPEVDYPLLLETIRALLFNAKVNCTAGNDQSGVEQCELYLGRVDLMTLLVKHNYNDLPKLSTLGSQRTLQLLRDRLLRHERLDLALQVSTKCNLDPTGVWFAMGVRDLSLHGLEKAREKFDRCLKPAMDKNSTARTSTTQLLDEVIKKLEEMHAKGTVGMLPKIIEFIKSSDQLLKEPELQVKRRCQFDLDSECHYYLQRYGTHLSRLSFLMRRKQLEPALAYCVENAVAPDAMIEGVVSPAIQNGSAEVLVLLLERGLDQLSDYWRPCLPKICDCLLKSGLSQPLYQLQCRTGDHVRAAMTCVHEFHLRGATSYTQLAARREPLERAIGHLRQAMRSLSSGESPDLTCILRLPEKELRSLIRSLQLHLDVVAYLGKAAIAERKPVTSFRLPNPLPTLLTPNRGEALIDLSLLILLSSPLITDGLSVLSRLSSDIPLPSDRIAELAIRYLAKDGRSDSMKELLSCWSSEPRLSLGLTKDQVDSLIVTAMRKMTPEMLQAQPNLSEDLLKLISSVSKRIEALIVTGKLKKAYLLAVSSNNPALVTQVRDEAAQKGQAPLRDMADKWLASRSGD